MEKLSATLAFSRRMARRLGAENVAAELSKLIHAVSQLDQSLNECTDSPSTYQFSDQAVLSETISDSYMAKKRRKKRAQSVVLSCAGEEPRNEHLGADSKDQVEEVLTAEHDVGNLRAVIRERLHTASRNEQVTFLQAISRSGGFCRPIDWSTGFQGAATFDLPGRTHEVGTNRVSVSDDF